MSSEPRRIALASPIEYGKPRFAVGGQGQAGNGDIKLYEWTRERQEMRMVGIQTDLGQIRAMAWSPHPSYPSILATGLSTGRTTLHSLSSSTLSPSPNQATTPLASLNIKHSRPATSLAFSSLDPNYIAVGLERHRSDHSLLVWDVADAIASSGPPIIDGNRAWARPGERIDVTNAYSTTRISEPRHLQAYCASELVNACAFLPSSYSLLASTNNRQIRLFDLRSPRTSAPPRDAVAAGAGAVLQYQTRAVYGLTPHPTRMDTFASFEIGQGAGTNVVRLWDTRMTSDVSSFDVNESIVGLEWWGDNLGVAMKEGGVNFWDIQYGRAQESVPIGGMKNLVKPRHHLQSFAFASSSEMAADVLFVSKDGIINIAPMTQSSAIATNPQGDLTVSSTSSNTIMVTPSPSSISATRPAEAHNTLTRPPPRVFPPSSSNTLQQIESIQGRPGPSRLGVPHDIPESESSEAGAEGVIEGYDKWRNISGEDISVVMRKRAEEGYGLGDLKRNGEIAQRYPDSAASAIWDIVDHMSEYMTTKTSISSNSAYNLTHQGIWGIWTGQISPPTTSAVPAARPGRSGPNSSRSGASSADPVVREPIRQGSAAWASLKSQAHRDPSQTPTPASSTAAVSSFRPRTLSSNSRARATASTSTPSVPVPSEEYLMATAEITQLKVESGLAGHSAKSALPGGDRTACRRMILALCEPEHSQSGRFDTKTTSDDERMKKAAWAYFANDEERAIRILLDSSDARHRLTGATLASSLIRSASNRKPNKEEWASVIEGMDDPYIRAVLRRCGGESWEVVLRKGGEEGLDLVDGVVIAVNNLGDKELTEYLHTLYLSAIDPHTSISLSSAIPLLGLTYHLIPILQSYLDTCGDIQTTALLASLIPSKQLTPALQAKMERWIEGYRDILDSWRMFPARVDFDVRRQELAREFGGREGMSDIVKGNCPVCDHVLSRQELDHAQRKVALKGTTTWPNERICTFCGNALPRCVICLTHVEPKFRAGQGLDENYLPTGNEPTDTIDTAYVACQTCRHGGHASHILPWFEGGLDGQMGHSVCPVVGCNCQCASI